MLSVLTHRGQWLHAILLVSSVAFLTPVVTAMICIKGLTRGQHYGLSSSMLLHNVFLDYRSQFRARFWTIILTHNRSWGKLLRPSHRFTTNIESLHAPIM